MRGVSRIFSSDPRDQMATLLLYLTSFTVLFAFVSPVYTYDDILANLFIFIGLLFFFTTSSPEWR